MSTVCGYSRLMALVWLVKVLVAATICARRLVVSFHAPLCVCGGFSIISSVRTNRYLYRMDALVLGVSESLH
jgi:hypothetical protein